MAQKNKIYQALNTHTILANGNRFIVGFGHFVEFVENKKNTDDQTSFKTTVVLYCIIFYIKYSIPIL